MTTTDDDAYTNLDLDTADELLVNAGHPSIARALRLQTNANRNMIQGEWGQKVVEAFENILQSRVVNALADVQRSLDEQADLVQQILGIVKGADKNAKQALAVAKETGRGLKKLQGEVKTLQDGQLRISSEVSDLDTRHGRQWQEIIDRLAADEERLDRKRIELDDHNARIARLEARAALLEPDEVIRLIALVQQIAQDRDGAT